MSQSQLILIILLALAAVAAFLTWKQAKKLEAQLAERGAELQRAQEATDAAKKATETAKGKAQQLREQLDTARGKLNKLNKNSGKSSGKKQRASAPAPEPEARQGTGSAAAVVRVSDQELESRYSEKIEALQASLRAAEDKLARMEAAATSEANKPAPAPVAAAELPATDSEAPEDKLAALSARLTEVEQAAKEREKKLRRDLKRAEAKASAAGKRASSSHGLYAVIKGQLEMTEDKLARLKQKYEGAKAPAALASMHDKATAADTAPEAPAEPASEAAPEPAEPAADAAAEDAPTLEVKAEIKPSEGAPTLEIKREPPPAEAEATKPEGA